MRIPLFSFLPLLLISGLTFAQTSQQEGWFWQYPKPQGNDLNDVFVFSSDRAIAVGNIGTVIQTTDGGAHWQVQHHAAGTSNDLSGVHFTDSLDGWAVAGPLVLHSTDAGATWAAVCSDTSLSYNAVCFVDRDTGFVAGKEGVLLRTTDGGVSWDRRMMDDYLGGGWRDIFGLHHITFTDKNNGWIVGAGYYGNQIYHTTDCGRSWQWMELVILPKVLTGLYDIRWSDQQHGFIVGNAGVFLKTTDGGLTWQYRNLAEKYQKPEYQCFYSLTFTDSLNGCIVGGDLYAFILKTTDGGENWVEVANNNGDMMNHFYRIGFAPSPHQNAGWIVGQFGMIYRTTDGGQQWLAQREKKYEFLSVHFLDENTGWAVGNSGVILHTTDGGVAWELQHQADSLLFESVYALDTQNAFAVGTVISATSGQATNAVLSRTTDAGLHWTTNIDPTNILYNSVGFSRDSIGWISAAYGALLKTTNRGLSWYNVILDSSLSPATGRIHFVDSLTGWVGASLKTTDGGLHWHNQTLPMLSFSSASFVNGNLGWAVGDATGNPNIYKTTDGGDNWSALGKTYPGYHFAIFFMNETTGWIAGYNTSVQQSMLKTTDGGSTWHGQDIPSLRLNDITFASQNTGWAVGEGIFKTADGGGVMSVNRQQSPGSMVPHTIVLFQNYPNPFNPTTIISYGLPRASHVTLTVYNILGQKVAALVNGTVAAGIHEFKFDATGLSSGVYFYQLRAGPVVQTRKLLLLH